MIRKLRQNAPFFKTVAVIALPIIIQNFISTFVNIVDTIMVGNLGSAEIAAVGLGNQIFFILNMILFGVGTGGGVFTAQYWGKKDFAGIRKTLGVALTFGMVIAAIFTVAAIAAPYFLIGLYSKDPKVIQLGGDYLRTVAFCYPIMAINFVFMSSLRSTEQVKVPMTATIISLAVNVVLNYLFIYGIDGLIPAMGVVGAAFATVISRIVECSYMLAIAYRRKLAVAAPITELFSYNREFVRKFFLIAFPVIVNETFWAIGISAHNVIFARAGTDAIAAFNITGTVSQLTWVFFIGAGNAAAIIIGKKIGENNTPEAYSYANKFQTFMPLSAAVIGLLLLPLSTLLPLFFKVEPHILRQAQLMMTVLVCTYPFKAFNMCMIAGICRSGGDTVFAAIIDVVFLYTISIPLGALAALYWQFPAWIVYIFILSEDPLKFTSGLIRLRSKKWLHNVT